MNSFDLQYSHTSFENKVGASATVHDATYWFNGREQSVVFKHFNLAIGILGLCISDTPVQWWNHMYIMYYIDGVFIL